jgi:elongation factor P
MADLHSTQLRKGTVFSTGGKVYIVKQYRHVKKGRGLAVVRVKVQDIDSGAIVEKTFSSKERVDSINLSYQKAQYLYSDNQNAYFMDNENFSQFDISIDMIKWEKNFLKEGTKVKVTFIKDRVIGIEIPIKVTLQVTQSEPAIAGDSANNPTKNVEVETGYNLQTPLFIRKGDSIIINTESGTYVGKG